jgi:DNA-binding IclR family transcriptional regulator
MPLRPDGAVLRETTTEWSETDRDRLAEVAGISAPVFHADGSIAASLTLTMPAHRFDERHVGKVLVTAQPLSWRAG